MSTDTPRTDAAIEKTYHATCSYSDVSLRCVALGGLAQSMEIELSAANAKIAELTDSRDALQRFKDFVHRRLDTAGIEKNPNGPHSAEGCRIGDRLDIALNTPEHKAAWDTVRATHVAYEAEHKQRKELEAKIAELTEELLEEARLNGMGSEREARLLAQVAELTKERDALIDTGCDKIMAMSDDQINALCRLEGHDPEDEAKLGKQACEIVILKLSVAALEARLAAIDAQPVWQPIESAPKGQTVLIHYRNNFGNSRIVKAQLVGQYELEAGDGYECPEYCEERDEFYCHAGWYEHIDNWDEYTSVKVYQGEPSHWMPLPEPPLIAKPASNPDSAWEGFVQPKATRDDIRQSAEALRQQVEQDRIALGSPDTTQEKQS